MSSSLNQTNIHYNAVGIINIPTEKEMSVMEADFKKCVNTQWCRFLCTTYILPYVTPPK